MQQRVVLVPSSVLSMWPVFLRWLVWNTWHCEGCQLICINGKCDDEPDVGTHICENSPTTPSPSSTTSRQAILTNNVQFWTGRARRIRHVGVRHRQIPQQFRPHRRTINTHGSTRTDPSVERWWSGRITTKNGRCTLAKDSLALLLSQNPLKLVSQPLHLLVAPPEPMHLSRCPRHSPRNDRGEESPRWGGWIHKVYCPQRRRTMMAISAPHKRQSFSACLTTPVRRLEKAAFRASFFRIFFIEILLLPIFDDVLPSSKSPFRVWKT